MCHALMTTFTAWFSLALDPSASAAADAPAAALAVYMASVPLQPFQCTTAGTESPGAVRHVGA